MTIPDIMATFLKAIKEKAVYNKLDGISENQIYNWRKGRATPTVGDMLNVLHQLNLITITANEQPDSH